MSWQEVAARDLLWCQGLWDMMADGAVWAVPRSGLVFEKNKAEKLLFVRTRQPFLEGMPGTREEWRAWQEDDFEAIKARFALIGVECSL